MDSFFAVLAKLPDATRQKGVLHVICFGGRYLSSIAITHALALYYKLFMSPKSFLFNNKKYNYFSHSYNKAYLNERSIEVPIIINWVNEYNGKNILEVGNVLSHYFDMKHDVVDKYEKAPGVINCDIIDFKSDKKYDLVVSISTLEHVGFDEPLKDPMKIVHAISNIKNLLAVGGIAVITLPVGYNAPMDRLLVEDKIPFSEIYYLIRIGQHEWVESDSKDKVLNMSFGAPYPDANGLAIVMVRQE